VDRRERAERELPQMEIEEADEVHVLFDVLSYKSDRKYRVNLALQTCSCPDNAERGNKCKHVFAVELCGYRPKHSAVEEHLEKSEWKPSEDFTWF